MTPFISRLTGTWNLISYAATSLTNPEGVVYPLGPDCVGRVIFSAKGYVSAYIQATDIQPYSSRRELGATEAELAVSARKTISYTAQSYLEEVEGNMKQGIEYDVQMSLPPNWKGEMEVRWLKIWEDGGKCFLSLAPDRHVDIGGVERVRKVVTRKARDNSNAQLRGRDQEWMRGFDESVLLTSLYE